MQRTTTPRISSRRIASAAAAGVTLAGAVLASPAAAASADELTCGSVVTTDVTLTHDLTGCTEYGLVVGAPGITIDLAGHRITGVSSGSTLSGIYIDSHDGVTVRNGRLRGFARAIDAYDADEATFSMLDVRDTLEGLDVLESEWVTIEGLSARHNRSAITLRNSDDATIAHSVVRESETSGVNVRDSDRVHVVGNTISANTFVGLDLEGATDATVEWNVFRRNGLDGVYSIASDGGAYSYNIASDNDADGILADGEATAFTGNVARSNTGVGIRAADTAIDGGGNLARRNGEANCVGITCS
jgi:nitrous oxidase accessory protein NosD